MRKGIGAPTTATTNIEAEEDMESSWSQVFHESHASPISRKHLSNESNGCSLHFANNQNHTISTSSNEAFSTTTSRVLKEYGIVDVYDTAGQSSSFKDSKGDGEETCNDEILHSEVDESILLYRILLGFAKKYRFDQSSLKDSIRKTLSGCSTEIFPDDPAQYPLDAPQPPTLCPVMKLLTAGYPSQPALLQCSSRFATAMIQCMLIILTHNAEMSCKSASESITTAFAIAAATNSQVIYTSARFQAHMSLQMKAFHYPNHHQSALMVVWNIWLVAIKKIHNACHQRGSQGEYESRALCESLGQLTVIFGIAGVSPRFLRDIVQHITSLSSLPPIDRWAMVRVLTFVTEGAAGRNTGPIILYEKEENRNNTNKPCGTIRQRSRTYSENHDLLMVSSSASIPYNLSSFTIPDYFFIWTLRPDGWKRRISGLSTWPFRNDFGMAVWFRADHLDPSRYPVLLSYRSEISTSDIGTGGGGVDIALVPLERGTGANAFTIQISVYDCDRIVPVQTIHVPGCVLLGNVWYHVAVRHSNTRMKGVFSLSSRQQVTVLVNGNVVLHHPLVFPKIDASDTIVSRVEASTPLSPLLLPAMVRAASVSARRQTTVMGNSGMFSCVFTVCSDFEGQTTAFMIFNDNVSDAAFRALYQATGCNHSSIAAAGNGGTGLSIAATSLRKTPSADKDRWDFGKSHIVKKSRVLDGSIMNDDDDDDEVVFSQRRAIVGSCLKRNASVVDVIANQNASFAGDDDPTSGSTLSLFDDDTGGIVGGELLKPSSFGSKVCVVWDPRRTADDMAIDVHLGAHLNLGKDAFSWRFCSPQDVIGSLGGVQVLILLFQSLLDYESYVSNGVSYLFLLLKAYLQDNYNNARELLRCGGIDVIEQLIHKADSSLHLLKSIHTRAESASLLLESLLGLRVSSSHCIGLETKIFSRLLFNIPLWLGSIQGDALEKIMLPVLSSTTKSNTSKIRDCVGVRVMVHALLTFYPDRKNEEIFEASRTRRNSDALLGMMFEIISCGVSVHDFSPFLCGLTCCLRSLASSNLHPTELQLFYCKKWCTALLFLLQIRPPISGLFECFVHTCGNVQSGSAWFLCSMIKSCHDQIRSVGLRCLAEYMDVISNSADNSLNFASSSIQSSSLMEPSIGSDIHSSVSRFGRLAKGFNGIGTGVKSVVATPSKYTPRIVVKLLWHLLKSHPKDLGGATHSALIHWACDDGGSVSASLSSLHYVKNHLIAESTSESSLVFSMTWADNILFETGSIAGRSLKDPLIIGAVIRLLKYLDPKIQELWLSDLLALVKANRKSTSILSSLADWQPCLFLMISGTLDRLRSNHETKYNDLVAMDIPIDNQTSNDFEAKTAEIDEILQVGNRLDKWLELYAILLGHLFREGGDKALDAVEKVVSLQRICMNGHDVVFLILSSLCENLFDYGTILEMRSISAEDWIGADIDSDSVPLKQSARLVTDAILSNGAKGLDMPTAVRSWRSLRHLAAVITALSSSCRFGVVDMFDYNHNQASSIDAMSGGLHGIRLPDGRSNRITFFMYLKYIEAACRKAGSVDETNVAFRRDIDRRFCAYLSAQFLSILDAFIFPDSLDDYLPASHLHSLALVRHVEPRVGSTQGPLVASAMRLSIVLTTLLEPGSVKLLQCASRMRCLVSWMLELLREESASDVNRNELDDLSDTMELLLLTTLMHCHRTLGRCSALLTEIESSSFEKYFDSRDSHKKYHRRLLRTSLELRDVVLLIYRGRGDFLRATLCNESFDALRKSLEGLLCQPTSKEIVVKEFLSSAWVNGFQDVETLVDISVPEQLSPVKVPLRGDQELITKGFFIMEQLAEESRRIAVDLDRTLDGCFEEYLEKTRRWAETDAVRELEYDGDSTLTRLSEKHRNDGIESTKNLMIRSNGAENRLRRIHRMSAEPWESHTHFKLACYTDRTGCRTLLVPNMRFKNHIEAGNDLIIEKEREKIDMERRAREVQEMNEVMRRNAEAFTTQMHDITDLNDVESKEEDNSEAQASDADLSDVESSLGGQFVEPVIQVDLNIDDEHEDGWDRIGTDEFHFANTHVDTDSWAKIFIWSANESTVARFDSVIMLSLSSCVEGKLLLTTHSLYFQSLGPDISVITKSPIEDRDMSTSESKQRRWRLTRLLQIYGRRYLLRHQALELFFSDGEQLFLNFFGGPKERDRFHSKLRNSCKLPMIEILKSLNPRIIFSKTRLSELWQQRKISNFDYLMALNRMAGRSFNDITQYPVFPWVLADYTSDKIDLQDCNVYRDLSKPIGALNPIRLAQLLERYRDLELFGFTEAEKFLYGSHYSSPGIVLHYMIRQEPFTTMAIELQSGRFDCPDRLFFDMAVSWNGCLSSSSDMKELIPEFFCLPEMFLNTNHFTLGWTQNGRLVDNVTLPPWAHGSAYEFVRIHRLALESEFVSQNLHCWVDLIFGYKQRGREAEAAHNLFHHLSYEGTVDLDKIVDEIDLQAAESHIQNFGQTPSQLLVTDPHPCRLPVADCWRPLIYNSHSVPKRLRCHTPSKQFGNKGGEFANGAIFKIHVSADSLLVLYADWSIGTYRWSPVGKTTPDSNRQLRMDKLRPLPRRELSTSRSVIKRGSLLPLQVWEQSNLHTGNWSFGMTIGGLAKEECRRKALAPPTGRLMMSGMSSVETTSANVGYLVSCCYWDHTIKVHSLESLRILASETGGHSGPICCFAEDDGLIVTGGDDATCRVWTIGHSDLAMALSDGYVQTSLGASNDGDQLLSCCHVLFGHDTAITALAIHSNLDLVASGSQDGRVCIHTIRKGEFIRSFRAPSMLYSPLNAASSTTTSINDKMTSVRDTEVMMHDRHCELAVRKLAIASTGHPVVLSHLEDCGLHSFSVNNGTALSSINAHDHLVDMIVCTGGEILVTGGLNCQVLIRPVHDLSVILSMLDLSRHGPIRCLAMTPDDLNPVPQFLFVGSEDGMVTVIDEDPRRSARST